MGRTRPRGGAPPLIRAERGFFRGVSRVSAPCGRDDPPRIGRGVARLCASAPDRHRLPRLTPRPVGPWRPMGLRLAWAPAAWRAVARAVAPAWPALRVALGGEAVRAVGCGDVVVHCHSPLENFFPFFHMGSRMYAFSRPSREMREGYCEKREKRGGHTYIPPQIRPELLSQLLSPFFPFFTGHDAVSGAFACFFTVKEAPYFTARR